MGIQTASAADNNAVGWRFDNTYARLPDVLLVPARPVTVRAPQVAVLNRRLADELGLDLGALAPEAAAALFAGQDLPAGSRPIAQAYAGHQFGHFTMLGDGRAILVGEHRTPSGRLVDIQLKGAGRTRFSRHAAAHDVRIPERSYLRAALEQREADILARFENVVTPERVAA